MLNRTCFVLDSPTATQNRCRCAGWIWPAALSLALMAGPAPAQENDACLKCHSSKGLKVDRDDREVSLYVDAKRYGGSVHRELDCISCHVELEDVETYPHDTGLERVQCMECHEDEDGPIAAYLNSTHGQLADAGNPLAPLCQDCHGSHYVLPLSDPESSISPFNIPGMCAQCHAEGAEVERVYDLPQEHVFQRYKQSIHGEGLYKQGLTVTAVCTSCHTGHNVLPHEDPNSTIHQKNVAATCMKCHGQIEAVHRKSIAGELWQRQQVLEEEGEEQRVVPLCVECHAPHEARKVFYDTNMSNADCLRCHRDEALAASSDGRSLYVSEADFGKSIHAREAVSCAQCHAGVSPAEVRPCSTITEKVNCALCHEEEVAAYRRGIHGQLSSQGDPNAPACVDCHGWHDTLEHSVAEDAPPLLKALVRESPSYSRNVPALCGRCHREGAPAARRYLGTQDHIVEHYAMSIHGKGLLRSGLTVTAVCTNCHTPHRELPSSDPDSSVHEDRIPATCGQCHDGIYEQYQHSVHAAEGNPDYVQLRGMPKLPGCADCHSSHTVVRTDAADFKLGIMEECGKCHHDVTETYFETFHGKASELGDTAKAKCYDCHNAHNILRPEHPESTLHRDNIVATCGACHPGSHRQFAGYLTHATHHDRDKYPWLFLTFWGMTTLLVGTFSFFAIHTVAWFPRSLKWRRELHQALAAGEAKPETHVVRFTRYQRRLHVMVIVSFFGLALTGMMLKFSYTQWAQFLARLFGGIQSAGFIHRVCAVITFAYFGLHLWDLFKRYRQSGSTWKEFILGPNTMLPRWSDVREFGQTMKWFFGRGPRPHYGKWTYWEKFDYFAVFWGVAIIGSTGLCLWFPELFTRFLPGWSINVATIIHSDEALLATGFIFTIHFFNSHFRPEKFPMDDVIFTGSIPLEELKHDRPRWYEEMVARDELAAHMVEKTPEPHFDRRVKILGFTALSVGIVLIVLIIYAMLFAYR